MHSSRHQRAVSRLSPHAGFGEQYVALDHERTGQVLYLHEQWTRIPKPPQSEPEAAPTKLALGVDGGFNLNEKDYTIQKERSLVLMPQRQRVPYDRNEIPELVVQSVEAIVAHASAASQDEVMAWQEELKPSKYAAALEQEDATGRAVPPDPTKWRDMADPAATENLWLNLSDGYIGGGRRNFDGTGGSGSALKHFQEMREKGKFYPLAVKLGTITPQGADVYSYAEARERPAPHHLSHQRYFCVPATFHFW